MQKSSMLTAAAVAAGVALLAPGEAQACEDCADFYENSMCHTTSSGSFGACSIYAEYDECGNEVGTDCNVWYDANCAGYGPGWDGPMSYWGDYWCWYSGYGCS